MKIHTFDLVINPPVGSCVAGYGPQDESWEIHDDLMMNALLMDDGKRKSALLGFDLIGMDSTMVQQIRKGCAEILQTEESQVILSCTHTHGGPHSRSTYRNARLQPYCDELVEKVLAGCRDAVRQEWRETSVYF